MHTAKITTSEFQGHNFRFPVGARGELGKLAAKGYLASVATAGETQWIGLDANGDFFLTDDANDMRAVRWVMKVTAWDDPDGYVRDVTLEARGVGRS